ncbi:hypothetical protein JCM5296_001492 [Sporobolomyces johnsonii]
MPPARPTAGPSRRPVRTRPATAASPVPAPSSPSPATAASRTSHNSQKTGVLPPLSAVSQAGRSLAITTSSAPTSEDALFTDGVEAATSPVRDYVDDGDLEKLYAGEFEGVGVGDQDYGRVRMSNLAKALFALSESTNERALSLPTFLSLVFSEDAFKPRLRAWLGGGGGANVVLSAIAEAAAATTADGAATSTVLQEDSKERVCGIVKREAEMVTRLGKLSPHGEAVNYLRRSARMSVKDLQGLSVREVFSRQALLLPTLHAILAAVVSSSADGRKRVVGTTASMLLFSRSPKTNAFQWLLSHSLHFRHAPAAVFTLLNSLGLTMSYASKMDALESLSGSVVAEAQQMMQDPTTGKLLVYDNFDFATPVQETTVDRQQRLYHCTSGWVGEIVVPKELEGEERARVVAALTSPSQWDALVGQRLLSHPHDVLDRVLRLRELVNYKVDVVRHVMGVLARLLPAFSHLAQDPALAFHDPRAVPPGKQRKWVLPTLDQEQGSTSGNREVLRQFRSHLALDEDWFSRFVLFLGGDQLTLSRHTSIGTIATLETAASRFARASSFRRTPGLFHFDLNLIRIISKLFSSTPNDPLSLLSLSVVAGQPAFHPTRIIYYPFRRFFGIVLDALVLVAASEVLEIPIDELEASFSADEEQPIDALEKLAESLAERFLHPSNSLLEAMRIKPTVGPSRVSHMIELFKLLMLQRDFSHAVKNGHPSRFISQLSRLLPYFAAAQSHLYTELTASFLTELVYETPEAAIWPRCSALVTSNSDSPSSCVAVDMETEHVNRDVKGHRGSALSPSLLSKTAASASIIRETAGTVERDLGVFLNPKHASPSTTKEVWLLAAHLSAHGALRLADDEVCPKTLTDLEWRRKWQGGEGGTDTVDDVVADPDELMMDPAGALNEQFPSLRQLALRESQALPEDRPDLVQQRRRDFTPIAQPSVAPDVVDVADSP